MAPFSRKKRILSEKNDGCSGYENGYGESENLDAKDENNDANSKFS